MHSCQPKRLFLPEKMRIFEHKHHYNMKHALTILAAALALAGCCTNTQSVQTDDMENPVIEAIMARRSIRHYTDAPVEREKLQKIAECGINAPNAMNRQDWEVRIITDAAYFDGVTEIMKEEMPMFAGTDDPKFRNGFRNATAAIAIACPADDSGMLLQNVGLMSENICLAAHSLGLGTCIMGGPAMFLNTPKPPVLIWTSSASPRATNFRL